MMKVVKNILSLKMVFVEGSPERTWVLDTDALRLTTTSRSQWKPGKVKVKVKEWKPGKVIKNLNQ